MAKKVLKIINEKALIIHYGDIIYLYKILLINDI